MRRLIRSSTLDHRCRHSVFRVAPDVIESVNNPSPLDADSNKMAECVPPGLFLSQLTMHRYWVSKKQYWCKYCNIFVRDDAPVSSDQSRHRN